MQLVQKIIMVLTLLCYLAASSVAAAHAPSITQQQASASIASDIAIADEYKAMNCHSSDMLSGEKSSSMACKIFCSVMAQAMIETVKSISLDVKPLDPLASFQVSMLSRQLTVETHPPQ